MESFLSSIFRKIAHFDNIYLKLSTHTYIEVRFYPTLSKDENSKNEFYDIITNELYFQVSSSYDSVTAWSSFIYSTDVIP